MACVSQRVPVLLAQGRVRLLVVDSVAALFRSEFQADQGLERSRHLTSFASALHKLSSAYQLPILCVNQVGGVRVRLRSWLTPFWCLGQTDVG